MTESGPLGGYHAQRRRRGGLQTARWVRPSSSAPIVGRSLDTTFQLILIAVTHLGLVLNEVIGPAVIMAALALWAVELTRNSRLIFDALRYSGVLVWTIPCLALVSYQWSEYPDQTLRQSIWLLLTVFLATLSPLLIRIERFMTIIVVTMAGICLVSLVVGNRYYDGMTDIVSYAGIFQNKNSLAMCGAFLTLAALARAIDLRLARVRRIAYMAMALFGCLIVALARSIGTDVLIVYCAGMLTLIGLTANSTSPDMVRKVRRMLTFVLIVSALSVALVWISWETLLTLVQKDPTLTGRTVLWGIADDLIAEKPVLGTGYQAFWVRGNSMAEYVWELMKIDSRMGFHFHNIIREIAVQLGLVGATAVVVLLGSALFRSLFWLRRSGSIAALFAFVVILMITVSQQQAADLFSPYSYLYYLYINIYVYCLHAAWNQRHTGLDTA